MLEETQNNRGLENRRTVNPFPIIIGELEEMEQSLKDCEGFERDVNRIRRNYSQEGETQTC